MQILHNSFSSDCLFFKCKVCKDLHYYGIFINFVENAYDYDRN